MGPVGREERDESCVGTEAEFEKLISRPRQLGYRSSPQV